MDRYHAMEMEFEKFETNVDPDLTQNDSMNQTQTSTNFTKEEKSILKQFYAEIPNPTDEEIETLAQEIEHQSEKVHKWFQYKKSEKQKKCITCLKFFGFLFDWKKQLKKHITEGCQQTEKQRANFGNDEDLFVIEKILGKRIRNGIVEYLIKWERYGIEDSTWESKVNFEDTTNTNNSIKIEAFEKEYNKQQKVATPAKIFSCNLCDENYNDYIDLDKHFKSAHKDEISNKIPDFANISINNPQFDALEYYFLGNTPLHNAAYHGKYEMFQSLTTNCHDARKYLNVANNDGHTPYQLAAKMNHFEILEFILLFENTDFSKTSLHIAVEENNIGFARFLIAKGVSVHEKDSYGKTPLHWATEIEMVKLLIANGADVNTENNSGWTPLHEAVEDNQKGIVKFLIENGANVDAKSSTGSTSLHIAALDKNRKEILKFLIQNGAKVNAGDNLGETPLHFAVKYNRIKIAKILIENGANINAKTSQQHTPLHFAIRKRRSKQLEMVMLLIEKGADINAKCDTGSTPLHFASAIHGKYEIVKFLIQNGANINAKTNLSWTPLHAAAKNNQISTTKLLIENGARVNEKNNREESPLHIVALNGNQEIVKNLIENGARIDGKDIEDKTPIYVAAKNANFGIVELLNETKKRKAETELPEETYSNKDPCMICLGPKNGLYVLLPCGHASLCELCCLKIMFQNDYSKCPSCRKPIQDYKKVFIVTN